MTDIFITGKSTFCTLRKNQLLESIVHHNMCPSYHTSNINFAICRPAIISFSLAIFILRLQLYNHPFIIQKTLNKQQKTSLSLKHHTFDQFLENVRNCMSLIKRFLVCTRLFYELRILFPR